MGRHKRTYLAGKSSDKSRKPAKPLRDFARYALIYSPERVDYPSRNEKWCKA